MGTGPCAEVQRVEDAALWAFKAVVDVRLKHCPQLKGFRLQHMPTRTWIDTGREVVGLTACDKKTLWVGNEPLIEGSMVHEYAHALQGCDPLPPYDKDDFYHSNWEDGGIYDAIERAKEYDGGI